MEIINVSLAILCVVIVFTVLTPNRWTLKRVPKYTGWRLNKYGKQNETPHGDLMDAVRKAQGRDS